jgi:RNA polymerase sigma-70 factor (ECF subfamily)
VRRARCTEAALVDGAVALVMAPLGRLAVALSFTFAGDRIAAVDIVADPQRLATLEVGLLDDPADPADPDESDELGEG